MDIRVASPARTKCQCFQTVEKGVHNDTATAGGAKITFAEARRTSGEDRASPRVAVFLQTADLAALRRLLDWTAGAADTPPEGFGGSMH